MSTRVIPKANTVRTTFNKAVEARVERLVDVATQKMDAKLRAHFDKALASGEEPYPPPYYRLDLVILQGKDFASGNDPEAAAAFQSLAHGTPDGDKFARAITEVLQKAGFQASVGIDDGDGKQVTISVSDSEFTNWAYNNNVDNRAQQSVQETLQQRRERELNARAKDLVPQMVGPLKQALRDAMNGAYWNNGVSAVVDIPALAPFRNDSDVLQAACDLASKQLSTKASEVSAYAYRGSQIQVEVYFNTEQAFRGFMRTLAK